MYKIASIVLNGTSYDLVTDIEPMPIPDGAIAFCKLRSKDGTLSCGYFITTLSKAVASAYTSRNK